MHSSSKNHWLPVHYRIQTFTVWIQVKVLLLTCKAPATLKTSSLHLISWILNKFTWHCPSSLSDYLEWIDYSCIYARPSVVIKPNTVVCQEKNRTLCVASSRLAHCVSICVRLLWNMICYCTVMQTGAATKLVSAYVWESALLDACCNKKLSAETQGDH